MPGTLELLSSLLFIELLNYASLDAKLLQEKVLEEPVLAYIVHRSKTFKRKSYSLISDILYDKPNILLCYIKDSKDP